MPTAALMLLFLIAGTVTNQDGVARALARVRVIRIENP